jgi:Fe(3+) dicitrate transport protein
MRLRAFSIFLLFSFPVFGQDGQKLKVIIEDSLESSKGTEVKIYDSVYGLLKKEKLGTYFEINISQYPTTLYFYVEGYPLKDFTFENKKTDPIALSIKKVEELNEVVLNAQKRKIFNLSRLGDYEGTSIYAGKKTEVIQVGQIPANIAANNARQIYAQISGLNIYQNDDAGLQLNIGGRGLDPNRTSNFNTRQNGYDISADVLGYPESYYSPPAEAIEEIQIVRGAASLQYGTQFGGLVNFKLVAPPQNKGFGLKTRNTIGSNQLYTNYTEIKGKVKSFSYLSYFNFKSGDGFRPNSKFDSRNYFAQFKYQISPKTYIKAEFTLLDYLAQQAGGLSDKMFKQDPFQSNRERNWFDLDWFLYQTEINHSFSKKSNLELQLFGLDSKRKALGFRSNRVSQIDPFEERDLIYGNFKNYGL